MSTSQWFAVRKELRPRPRIAITVMSFILPLLIWSLVSYVPWIWHPKVDISDPGSVSYFKTGHAGRPGGVRQGIAGGQ